MELLPESTQGLRAADKLQVMVATTGAQLLDNDAVKDLRTLLLPLSFIVTPNIPEARVLLAENGKEPPEIRTVHDMETMARRIRELGPDWVLIKGGHTPFRKDGKIAETDEEKEIVVNILVGREGVTRMQDVYQKSKNTHGTGCSLASAIASNLSLGLGPVESVKAACKYVEAGIRFAPGYGEGNGPLNHFHSTYRLPFSP